jgi:alpha-beta hydrolase superfamily lysophospholipase
MEKITRYLWLAVAAVALGAALIGCATVGTTPTGESQWRSFKAADGTEIHYRYWAGPASPRAVIQIVHGAGEHSGRYDRFAKALVNQGYAVYAMDHRGHGLTLVRSRQLGDAGPDAWNAIVSDEQQMTKIARAEHPGAKLVLFGHSLGSFLAQDYIERSGASLDGLVLSGTSYGPAVPKEFLGALDDAAKKAPLAPSDVWAGLFKDFNKPFSDKPGFDWLSRDPAEVQKYLHDPLCGFNFNNEFVRDIFKGGFYDARDPAREARIPKNLPILVIQGSLDPVGENLKGTQALLDRYKALGLTNVSHKFYDGARHEVLNETNRDEVTRDVLNWLKTVVG